MNWGSFLAIYNVGRLHNCRLFRLCHWIPVNGNLFLPVEQQDPRRVLQTELKSRAGRVNDVSCVICVVRSHRQLQTCSSFACRTPCRILCSPVCPPAPTLSGHRRSAPSCESTAFIGEDPRCSHVLLQCLELLLTITNSVIVSITL